MLRNVLVQAFDLNAENDLTDATFDQLIIRRFAQFGPTMRDALSVIRKFDGQIISPEVLSAIQDIMRFLIGRKGESDRKSKEDLNALPPISSNPAPTTSTSNTAPGARAHHQPISDMDAEKLDKSDVVDWYREYILDKLLATVDQATRGKLDFREHAVLFEQHFSVVCLTWRVSMRAPVYGSKLRDRLFAKNLVPSLVTLADTLPPHQVGRMPLKLLHMVVSYQKFPSAEARAEVVKDALGFPQVFASRVREWVDCFVVSEEASQNAQLQAAYVLDLSSGVMRNLLICCPEAAIAATRKAKLVDELFVYFPTVKRMGMLWPRILGCLMEVMSQDPRSEYVHLGLDLAQTLRRMKVVENCVLPGLFCLRVEGLRRLPRLPSADDDSDGNRSPRRSILLGNQLGAPDRQPNAKTKSASGGANEKSSSERRSIPASPTSPKQSVWKGDGPRESSIALEKPKHSRVRVAAEGPRRESVARAPAA